jgi:hypothetical protein
MWPSRIFGEGEIPTSPRPAAPAACRRVRRLSPTDPGVLRRGGGWVLELCRLAYQPAQSALRPSWHDCAMTASWN